MFRFKGVFMLRYVMINVLQCDGCRIYLLDSNGEWLSLHSQEKLISIAKNLGWNTLKLGYVKYFCPE